MRCFAGLVTATLLVVITFCSLAWLTTATPDNKYTQRCPRCYTLLGPYCTRIPNCANNLLPCQDCRDHGDSRLRRSPVSSPDIINEKWCSRCYKFDRATNSCVKKHPCVEGGLIAGDCPKCYIQDPRGFCVRLFPCT